MLEPRQVEKKKEVGMKRRRGEGGLLLQRLTLSALRSVLLLYMDETALRKASLCRNDTVT